MADVVRVRIYDSRIQSFFNPGGSVWSFTRSITSDAARMGRIYAPKRTRELANSIDFSVTPAGRHHCIGTVRATAPHAMWVIGGTGPIIYPRNGQYLRVPIRQHRTGRGGRFVLLPQVSGQSANNFLDRAKVAGLRMNGV